ncbi:NAD(P)/FAD-dependent oxidoreductase [Novosphingobium sp.]|uniref:NAD(P)/FAD-dependent oxidoreductase n=1 Tax=Novosphingobium sp. TaxID=1874826 RepID=UPI003B51FCCD
MRHVAIVGAGVSGLSCAETLSGAGIRTTLFDKGRGPGGRMASRRIETAQGTAEFDFGAQYFTARDPLFIEQVNHWERSGLVSPWPAARTDAYIGIPTMKAVLQHLCLRHTVHFSSLVKGLVRNGQHWQLAGPDTGEDMFDSVVLALPAEQTATIITLHDFNLGRAALYARSQPCWTGMFVFSERVEHVSGLIRDSGIITWAASNRAKPGRSGPESWVVQAGPRWSLDRLEQSPDDIGPHLLAALEQELDIRLPAVIGQSVHRWRYALSAGTDLGCLWNETLALGACGDWLVGPRVESAWISGRLLADKIIAASSVRNS